MKDGADAVATEMLESVIAAEPANQEARVLLAQSLLSNDPKRIQDLLVPVEADSEFNDKANALRTLARWCPGSVQSNFHSAGVAPSPL